MAKEIKNLYQMDLVKTGKTKLYNMGEFWAFNIAKYRALLSNEPSVIKHWYKQEAQIFFPDVYNLLDLKRSFYYGDDFVENAEEFFGIIPMICESLAKMVCGSGYEFVDNVPAKIKGRLKAILDENEFDTLLLKASIIETCGIGDGAWYVYFDPEVSDLPIIELIPAERLIIKKKDNRIVEYGIKQRIFLHGEETDYELHTIYSKRRRRDETGGAVRWVDDGVLQRFRIWGCGKYQDGNDELKKQVFKEYGIAGEEKILPLVDIPVIYLPNTLNNTRGAGAYGSARPYGIVFGLESVSAAIDEILSNCVDTVRKSFPFLIIDEQMIPSDIYGNKEKGAFSTRRHSFLLPKNAKDAEKLLQQIQAKLNTTEFVESLKFQINIALNKVGLNAATLGLQLTGHVEAEATQNAKERNSIRTRNVLAADYERYLTKLFAVLLQYEDYINGSVVATDRATGREAFVVEDYHGIKASFRKYIVDTPEEVSDVLARKVQGNLMSIFAAVQEQHPDWKDEEIYRETNIIYAEAGKNVRVEDPEKAAKESAPSKEVSEKSELPEKGEEEGASDSTEDDEGQNDG